MRLLLLLGLFPGHAERGLPLQLLHLLLGVAADGTRSRRLLPLPSARRSSGHPSLTRHRLQPGPAQHSLQVHTIADGERAKRASFAALDWIGLVQCCRVGADQTSEQLKWIIADPNYNNSVSFPRFLLTRIWIWILLRL